MHLTYEQMKGFIEDTKFRIYTDPQRPFVYWVDLGIIAFDLSETEDMNRERFLKFLKKKAIRNIQKKQKVR